MAKMIIPMTIKMTSIPIPIYFKFFTKLPNSKNISGAPSAAAEAKIADNNFMIQSPPFPKHYENRFKIMPPAITEAI